MMPSSFMRSAVIQQFDSIVEALRVTEPFGVGRSGIPNVDNGAREWLSSAAAKH
jgi:hypothetical protein